MDIGQKTESIVYRAWCQDKYRSFFDGYEATYDFTRKEDLVEEIEEFYGKEDAHLVKIHVIKITEERVS